MHRHAQLLILVMLAAAPWANAALMAGVETVDITPPAGGSMGGYSARGQNVSEGVHDPLHAKALVLKDNEETLAIVTMDLVGLSAESVEIIRRGVQENTGIAHIMLLPSHTHSGPSGSRDFPTKENPWVAEMEQQIIGAVAAANGALVPVKYGVGQGEVREGHNRRKVEADGTATMLWANRDRQPTAPVDYALGVIRFEKEDGQPLVTLVNFTCHPVVLGPENLQISADYPGVMMAAVEDSLGGVCMFVQGASGDINPYWDKTPPSEGAFEEMTKMGKAVAAEVIRVSLGIATRSTGDADLTVNVEVLPLNTRWDLDAPEVRDALEKQYGKTLMQAYLRRFERPMNAELYTVTLGDDLAIAGWPGEFFVQLGLDLKERSAIPNTFVFGYCNRTFGYFPTINAAAQGGYGAGDATIVEVGAGETFVTKSLKNLYYQTERLNRLP
jgi:neutral ceramidase